MGMHGLTYLITHGEDNTKKVRKIPLYKQAKIYAGHETDHSNFNFMCKQLADSFIRHHHL